MDEQHCLLLGSGRLFGRRGVQESLKTGCPLLDGTASVNPKGSGDILELLFLGRAQSQGGLHFLRKPRIGKQVVSRLVERVARGQ